MSVLKSVLSFLSDASWPILFLVFGLVMLLAPYDKVKEIFPNLSSQKAIRIVGGVLVVIAILCGILLAMDLLAM